MKCAIFDAVGVVIHFEYFTVELEKVHNISHEKVQPFFKNEFQDCVVGKADTKEKMQPYFKDWGWKGTVDDFLNFWFETENRPDKELLAYIKNLREQGVLTVLATNQEHYRTKFVAENMKFNEVFDIIISSAEAGHKKPSLEFYSYVYKKINENNEIKKEDVIFWDDTPENVLGAKELGIQAKQYVNIPVFKKEMELFLKQ